MKDKTLKTLEYDKIKELLMKKTESSLGKEKASLIRPSKNINRIKRWSSETEEALNLLIKRSNPPLFGIKNIEYEINRLKVGGALIPSSLIKISDLLRVSRKLKHYIKEDDGDIDGSYPIIEDKINNLSTFKYMEDKINESIINEEEISDEASSQLKNIRIQISNKNNQIRSRLDSIVSSQINQKYLQDNIVTIREGRHVIPVRQEYRRSIPGLIHDTSSSGATVFIEPNEVVELNNELRDLEIQEEKEIERILKDLSTMVSLEVDNIYYNQKVLRDLDFIFAKGKLALEMDANKPIFNNRGYINLKQARHPLLDKEVVVPIDIYLGDKFDSLVITGPNTGGKTVSLKTVGLCTLMGQTGLHIPADSGSEIAVFDGVHADIGDEQSIEQSLSTFSSHMINIVDILENLEKNSLVLFDELGAGTDPTEGAALAMSILDNLLKKEDIRTIATTHYSQLKLYALTTENVTNASVEFDIETLRPTYRLSIGVPGKSNAFEISSRLGLEDEIINNARTLISKENVEFEDVLQAIESDRKEAERKKEESNKLNLEIQNLHKELEKEKQRIENMREKVITDAKVEAREILKEAEQKSELIISELKNLSEDARAYGSREMRETQDLLKQEVKKADKELTKDILNVKSDKIPKKLLIGESVEVLTVNQVGEVLSLPDDSGNVQVQVGIMKLNVPLETLRRTESKEKNKLSFETKSYINNKTRNVKTEIDLRGKNIEEAILELDKYIDDVYIAGFKEVSIIHGKGTGALREGLQEYFRKHKLVKSFRQGKYGEGGQGVTVLNIK